MKTWITPILCCLLLIAADAARKGIRSPRQENLSRGKALMPPSPETAASPSPRHERRGAQRGRFLHRAGAAGRVRRFHPAEGIADAAGYLRRLPLHPARNAGTDAAASRPTDSGTRFAFTYCPQTKAAAPLASGGAERLHGLPLRADPCEDRSLDQIPRNTLKVSVREPFLGKGSPLPLKTLQKKRSTSLQNLLCIPKACPQFSGTNGLWSRPSKEG